MEIDTRPKAAVLPPAAEEDVDLVINIDLFGDGYTVSYQYRENSKLVPYNYFSGLTRQQMIAKHIQVIRDTKPKTAAVRSNEFVKDAEPSRVVLHPGILAAVLEGKMNADNFQLRGE